MREALTVIGFVLILAFAALFAAPLYIDWNRWRPEIEAELSKRLGVPVKVEGTIDARLLPQPWLSLHTITVGDGGSPTRASADSIEGEVNLPALLHGDIELSNLVVESPHLTVATAGDGRLQGLAGAVDDRAVILRSFEIRNGSLDYSDVQGGEDVRIGAVHLIGAADSLRGPMHAEGGALYAGVPQIVRIALGRAEAGGIALKGSIIPADRPLTIDLDGRAALSDGRPLFTGTATLARPSVNMRGDRALPQEPWTVRATTELHSGGAKISRVEIQIGPDERALRLSGTGSAVLGPGARIDAKLQATQLDIDRLAALPTGRRLAPAAVLEKVRAALPAFTSPAWPTHLTLQADGVVLGGDLIQNVSTDLATEEGGWRVASLEGELPGRADVRLDGALSATPGRLFDGRVRLQAGQAATLLNWLQGLDRATSGQAARRLGITASVSAGRDAVDFADLNLTVDDATVRGRLGWRRLSPDTDVGRIEAVLSAERLDLDTLPAAARLLPGGAFAEADVQLDARSMTLAGVQANAVSGRAAVNGRSLLLQRIKVNDLGGASLTADGRIDDLASRPRGEIRANIEGRDLAGLAAALQRSPLPSRLLAMFGQRAAALSPASANLVLSFGESRRLTLDGTLGGSLTTAVVDLGSENDQPTVDATLRLDNPEAMALLRQIGIEPLPIRGSGHGQLEASLQGTPGGTHRWTTHLHGANVDLDATGRAVGDLDAPKIAGEFTARASDVFAPAALFGISLPGALPGDTAALQGQFRVEGQRVTVDHAAGTVLDAPFTGTMAVDIGSPARVEGQLAFKQLDAIRLASTLSGSDLSESGAGTGMEPAAIWSAAPFGQASTMGLVGQLGLTASRLTVSSRLPDLKDASATLRLEPGIVSLDDLSAGLADGRLSGAMRFSRTGPEAALTGRIALDGANLASPGVRGSLSFATDLQGTGRGPDALVSSLTGGGTVALRRPVFSDLAPSAVETVAAAADKGLAIDQGHVAPALQDAFKAGDLASTDLESTLSLAGGVARVLPATARADMANLSLAGSLDLATLRLRSDLVMQPPVPADGLGGPAPAISVAVSGPLDDLKARADASPLVAWLSIRQAEQQAKRLEKLQAEQEARDRAAEEQRRAEGERMQRAIDAQRALDAQRAADAAAKAEAERIMQGPTPPTAGPR